MTSGSTGRLDHPDRNRAKTRRRSLRGGYIDRLRRHVREVSGTATRVTDSYRMLLDTIGLAFDECTAREGDRVQKAGIWLAVGFGVLGLSGVAQATAPLPDVHRPAEPVPPPARPRRSSPGQGVARPRR